MRLREGLHERSENLPRKAPKDTLPMPERKPRSKALGKRMTRREERERAKSLEIEQ